jgi:PHD/YefM family antitoxin component YafN of YafNO toxin-antitoxin module
MGKLSREKGKAFERAVAKVLRPLFGSRIRRGFQTRSGRDESDVEGTPWWIECKHERCVNVRKAMAQAQLATDGRPVVVIAKDNNAPPFICMSLDAWVQLIETVIPQQAVAALKELTHEETEETACDSEAPEDSGPQEGRWP